MGKNIFIIIFLLFNITLFSQKNYEDSIKAVISDLNNDSLIELNYLRLAFHYVEIDSQKVEFYLKKAKLSIKGDVNLELFYNRNEGFVYRNMYNYKLAIKSFAKNIEIAEKYKDSTALSYAYSNIAYTYYIDYKYENAIEYYEKAAELYKLLDDKIGVGQSYNNMGIMYEISNDIKMALEYYLKAIKIYENEKTYKLLIGTTSNIGLIYIRQERFKEAIDLYNANSHYLDSVTDVSIKIDYYLNLGISYDNDMQLKEAEKYFLTSLKLAKSINNKRRITTSLTNLATNSNLQKKYDQAIQYNLYALEIKKESGDKASLSISQIELGNSYQQIKKYNLSKKYYKKALENAVAVSYKDYIQKAYLGLSYVYYITNNYKAAYDYNVLANQYKDSLINEENLKMVSELKEQYEADKKEQQIKLQSLEIASQKVNIQKEKAINEKKTFQRNMFIIGFILMIFLAIMILYFLKQKQKINKVLKTQKIEIIEKNEELNQQNEEIRTQRDSLQDLTHNLNQQNEEITAQRDEIEKQKEIVEEIHYEVEQSIDYATRLQSTILPEEKLLIKHLTDHFVLFKPKDKVSGDFYWWTHIENHTIITAADCTGHGVPGAFMSMLGGSFLREIVEKEYITNTGLILKKLRKEIIKSLKQKGDFGEQKDGMDMAIISINHETNIVQFSGANNPLYIIKNKELKINDESKDAVKLYDNSNFWFYEVKPNKMPIAIYEKMDKFTAHEIQLEKGDQLYMFSDGFADQFGGTKGKKFMYKPFKKLLLENADKPMTEQKEILNSAFENWKGDMEQIDDVVVLGIKI